MSGPPVYWVNNDRSLCGICSPDLSCLLQDPTHICSLFFPCGEVEFEIRPRFEYGIRAYDLMAVEQASPEVLVSSMSVQGTCVRNWYLHL